MRQLTLSHRVLATIALSLLGTGIGRASIIGYSAVLSLAPDPTDPGNPFTLTLPKFNSALGTLTSARLYFREDLTVTSMTFQNLSAAPLTYEFGVSSDMASTFSNSANAVDTFEGNVVTLFDTRKLANTVPGSCKDQGLPVGGNSLPVLPGNCTPILVGGSATVSAQLNGNPISALNPYTVSNTDSIYTNSNDAPFAVGTSFLSLYGLYLDASNLSSYIGGGNFQLVGTTDFSTTVTANGGNLNVGMTSTRVTYAEIDYTYTPATPTPEPATMGLIGSVLAGVGLLRKRRKK